MQHKNSHGEIDRKGAALEEKLRDNPADYRHAGTNAKQLQPLGNALLQFLGIGGRVADQNDRQRDDRTDSLGQ